MNIYLVRHGESMSNVDKAVHKTTADHNIPLSTAGVFDARRAGRLLRQHLDTEFEERAMMPPWKHIRLWASPYLRTRQTADELERELEPWIKDRREHPLLCEQQFGLFDGLSDEELIERYPHEHAHYKKCEDHGGRFWARMPLGESRFDVACRVHQAFGTFHRDNDKHGISSIIVVCHGVTMRAFVMMWCHLSPEWFDTEPNPKNGAVRLISSGVDMGYLPIEGR
jgi:2,3-bisphosphoglycerate-dependent phosphoglycerate mutase